MGKRKYGKRSKKRSTKRRRVYKRRAPRRRLTSRSVPSGFPTIKVAKMRYAEVIGITSTVGAIQHYVFRANSIFDPNYTGAGHQPMSHDTWSTMYNHYTVIGSKLSAVISPSEANLAPGYFGSYLTDGLAAPYTEISAYREAKRGFVTVLAPDQKKTYVTNKFSAKRFFNITDVKDNTSRIGAAIAFNPTEQAYFNLWYATADGSTAAVNVLVTIDYIVTFGEPKDIVQS